MRRHQQSWSAPVAGVIIALFTIALSAHVTPPRVLMTDREALMRLFPGAAEAQPQQMMLTPAQRQQIQKQFGWKAEQKYRVFPVQGSGALVVVIDYTLHGPVRTAVAVDAQGRVKGAAILEMQEESYFWLKPTIDTDFAKPFIGSDCQAKPQPSADQSGDNMTRFYRSLVLNQLCHAAVLYRVGKGGLGT